MDAHHGSLLPSLLLAKRWCNKACGQKPFQPNPASFAANHPKPMSRDCPRHGNATPEFHSISESPSEGASMSSMQSRDANQIADLRIHRTAKRSAAESSCKSRRACRSLETTGSRLCSALAISTGFAGCNSLRDQLKPTTVCPTATLLPKRTQMLVRLMPTQSRHQLPSGLSDASTAAVVPVSYQEPLSSHLPDVQ